MTKDVVQQRDLDPQIRAGADVDVDAEHRPEVARRASNAGLNREASQIPADQVHDAAARGTASPTTALPFADQIQASFGAHDISHIKAHVGGDSAQATKQMGAQAYASGDHVVFGQQPDLHTAAHEAAHIVQQAKGVNLYGGVGDAGDSYERHADEVADRVVAGKPAGDLLGPVMAQKSAAPAVQQAVQRKEEKKEATPEDKAAQHDKAEVATSNALQGSMQLAAKQLHGVAGTIEKALTGPGNEGGYDVRLQGIPHQFSMAQDIGRHVMSVAKKSDALLKDPNLVHHRKTDFDDLWGAYSRFESAMNAANKMSAEHNGPLTNLNPDFVKNEMRDLFSVFGGLYDEKATTPNSAEAKGTEADAIKGALLEHVDAAYEAARALHLGEPNGSERFKFHVKETRSLLKAVESTKGGLAPYKDKLKHLVTEVRALEKDRPGMDGVIKDVLPVVDELEKLSK